MTSTAARAALLVGLLLIAAGCRPPVHSANPAGAYASPRAATDYPWTRAEETYQPLAERFPAPQGFQRVPVAAKSWGEWLRNLPLRRPGVPVRSRNGSVILPANASALAAVVDLDVLRDQECADTILRLCAEYRRWADRENHIVFHLTSSGKISWPQWQQGMRPRLEGSELKFDKTAPPDGSRASFEKYLAAVFAWCGTISLTKDAKRVPADNIQVGDFFAHAGSPGHAVLIADLVHSDAGDLKALLLQGYMPAQSAHILAPNRADPWFDLVPGQPVDTPLWGAFEWSELRRFTIP